METLSLCLSVSLDVALSLSLSLSLARSVSVSHRLSPSLSIPLLLSPSLSPLPPPVSRRSGAQVPLAADPPEAGAAAEAGSGRGGSVSAVAGVSAGLTAAGIFLRCRHLGAGFGVWGVWFEVGVVGFFSPRIGFMVPQGCTAGLGCRVQGAGCRV